MLSRPSVDAGRGTVTKELTASRVNRAGKTIRRVMRGEADPALHAEFPEAVEVLLAFRAAHQRPLTTANMGLRSIVKTVDCEDPEVSQRLKRVPTIVDKLRREPTLALANMQDLGGCRAVLRDVDEVRRVQARIEHHGRVERVADYIAAPRASGYRGVHAIVRYHDRRIEIQLRTRVMHSWAVTVETLSGIIASDVKSGEGPKEVQELMSAISQAMALEEQGVRVDDELEDTIDRLRIAAAPHLMGGQR
jgi:ppGpp synthetase/RelA/SpoT-type nucleotidyltranferase